MKKLQIACLQSRLRQTRTRAARRCQRHIEEQIQYKNEDDHIPYSAHTRLKAKHVRMQTVHEARGTSDVPAKAQ